MSDLPGQALAGARGEIEQVRDWLLRPSADTISACVPALERAVANLNEVLGQLGPVGSPAHFRRTVREFAREIRETQVLLVSAGRLYLGSLRRCTAGGALEKSESQAAQSLSAVG